MFISFLKYLTNLKHLCIINIGNKSHRKCVLPILIDIHHIAWRSKMWCIFYCSLFESIMYITLNKATFIVIEIINPKIRNRRKFTINTTSNLSISSRKLKVTPTSASFYFLWLTLYYIFF